MEENFFLWIRQRLRQKRYFVSKHAEIEREDEDIDVRDIEAAIAGGILLEDYSEDPRGHSCLIAGYVAGRWLHIVCGRKEDWVIIITVYIPKSPHWETPTERGDL